MGVAETVGVLLTYAHAIGHTRDRDETVADRKIVRGVRTPHPESSGDVHFKGEVLVPPDAPVAANREPRHQSRACTLRGAPGEVPEAPSHYWAQA